MKQILLISLICFANLGFAQVIWPGDTAPCNTTLNACADGISRGDVIEIHTNGPINESLSTNNGISLVAGPGFRPVFAGSNGIDISSSSPDELTVSISGITLNSGSISYNARGLFLNASTHLNITNIRIMNSNSTTNPIRVQNFNDHNLDINIAYNQISFDSVNYSQDRSGAIAISNGLNFGAAADGILTGRVYDNVINVVGEQSIGIGVYEESNGSFDLNISSNVLTGGNSAAMYVEKNTGSLGDSRLDFAHNAIYNNQTDSTLSGLKTFVYDGSLEINAINNTVVGAFQGFIFENAFGGVNDIKFYNNLTTANQTPLVINNPNVADTNVNITFENNNNLFFNNTANDPDFMAGPAHLTTDPAIKGLNNARLNAGSPAIEAGNGLALFFIADVPLIDADGLFRFKNGNPGSGGVSVDIGAYEAGDIRVLDVLKNSPTNDNPIESEGINADEFAKLQITKRWNPNTAGGGISDQNLGVYRAGAVWRIFTQDQTAMPVNAAFNVWKPASGSNNFVHTASDAISASESFTVLDRSDLNDNPDAILAVTHLWEGLYNDNPVGVFYNPFTDRWNIYNTNFVDMPWMSQFNVYYQTESSNAFIHKASSANSNLNATYIDHPLLNNSPCAQFQVTYDSGIVFESKIAVFYSTFLKQWSIFNQDGEPMPQTARFHVIVSADQIAECNDVIFFNGFD